MLLTIPAFWKEWSWLTNFDDFFTPGIQVCIPNISQLHGPVQQHGWDGEEGVDEGQDAAYLTNLK